MIGKKSGGRSTRCRAASSGAAIALAIVLGALAPMAGAQSPMLVSKADVAVRAVSKSKAASANVIVRLRFGLNDVVRRDVSRLKGSIEHEYAAIGAIDVQLPRTALEALAQFEWVERISIDAQVEKSDGFTTTGSMAKATWDQYKLHGSGVTVAVIDSGVSQHVDMLTKVDQVAFLTGSNGSFLLDDCGHGTHVAGIIAGNGFLSSGMNAIQTFYGVARGANILSIRVLDREGKGTVGDVLAGMQWALDNRLLKKIRVVNMSLGHVAFERVADDPLCQMSEQLWKAGIVVVCAAGNDGRRFDSPQKMYDNEGFGANYGSINSPGNSPYVITVGAMKRTGTLREQDMIATYSGRGPSVFDHVLKPDILAPGNRVVSLGYSDTYLNDKYRDSNSVRTDEYSHGSADFALGPGSEDSSSYFRMSGTSMSAPVVSGAVALMLESNPKLTPDQVKARLMFTATKWLDSSGVADPCSVGAGYLNVLQAVGSKLNVIGSALSPKLFVEGNGAVSIDVKSISGKYGIWGTGTKDPRVIWGARAMVPSSKFIGPDTKWFLDPAVVGGTRAVWGHTTKVEGTRAVWGNNDSTDGTRAVWGHGSAMCDLSSAAIYGE